MGYGNSYKAGGREGVVLADAGRIDGDDIVGSVIEGVSGKGAVVDSNGVDSVDFDLVAIIPLEFVSVIGVLGHELGTAGAGGFFSIETDAAGHVEVVLDGGKVFFKQNRATRGGRIFSVYKLRTMKENVDNYLSVVDDDRITKVGKILRRFRIDEIPQFINVIKGDMSIVGPRPEMLANIFNYTNDLPEFEYRLRVKAGITGYAQIAGKYNTSPRDKLVLDLMYIEEYSFWLDIKLLFQTLIVIFKKDSTEAFSNETDEKYEKYEKFYDSFYSGETE